MKPSRKISIYLLAVVLLTSFSNCGRPYYAAPTVVYENPDWAPPYYTGVRYYYLPDLEIYYDLSAREFVYPYEGQWLFSYNLPPMYASYDLYNGFVVALNKSVYQPWLHHNEYISHYPKNYYRNVYRNEDYQRLRGFNENDKKPMYRSQEKRNDINEPRKPNAYDKNPEPMNKRPDVNDKKPQPVDKRFEPADKKPEPTDKRPDVNDKKPQPAEKKFEPTDKKPEPTDKRPDVNDKKPQPAEKRFEPVDKKPEPTDKKPEVNNRKPDTQKEKSNSENPGKKVGQPVKVKPSMREPKKKVNNPTNNNQHH
ncbi:MAG: hypothetical protein JSU05_10030 [Bacteroidetes bacterium]|nr:hypothetical protein [Bacteroidota bacterium]